VHKKLARRNIDIWGARKVIVNSVMVVIGLDEKIGKTVKNTLPYLMAVIEECAGADNLLQATQAQLAKELDIAQSRISPTLKVLREWGFLTNVKISSGGKLLMINPQVRYVGLDKKKRTAKLSSEVVDMCSETGEVFNVNKLETAVSISVNGYEEMVNLYKRNDGLELPTSDVRVQSRINKRILRHNQIA